MSKEARYASACIADSTYNFFTTIGAVCHNQVADIDTLPHDMDSLG